MLNFILYWETPYIRFDPLLGSIPEVCRLNNLSNQSAHNVSVSVRQYETDAK